MVISLIMLVSVENRRVFWDWWLSEGGGDKSVAQPWQDLISRVSLASAKYLIYTAPTQFVYYHQVAEKNLNQALKKIDF